MRRLVLLKIDPIRLSSFCSRRAGCRVTGLREAVFGVLFRAERDGEVTRSESLFAGRRVLFDSDRAGVVSTGCGSFAAESSSALTTSLPVSGELDPAAAAIGSADGALVLDRSATTANVKIAIMGTKIRSRCFQAGRDSFCGTGPVGGSACVSWTRRAPSMSQKACSSS
jgi:hypothetical protein